jgi:hypothetical protein
MTRLINHLGYQLRNSADRFAAQLQLEFATTRITGAQVEQRKLRSLR